MSPLSQTYFRHPRRVPAGFAAIATLLGAAAMLMVPPVGDPASIWAPVTTWLPATAAACFGLAVAASVGCAAGLAATAGGRRTLRPALSAAITTALLAPASLAIPLWPALLAGAALLALPTTPRLDAANDNPAPDPYAANPFTVAA